MENIRIMEILFYFRYVANLKAYRDVIQINKDEKDLLFDLDVVLKRIRKYTNKWVGITTPDIIGAPAGHCLWVELQTEVFGCYWYQIKTIKFKENEVTLKIKQLRSATNISDSPRLKKATPERKVTPERKATVQGKATVQDKTILQGSTILEGHAPSPLKPNDESANNPSEDPGFDFGETMQAIAESCINKCSYIFTNIVTIKNTKDVIVFLSVLIMTLFTGAIELIKYLGDFSIRLMREASFFINSMSPIIIATINMIGRSIGGLYMLIAMLWRDRNAPVTAYQTQPPKPLGIEQNYYRFADRRGLPEPRYSRDRYRRSGVTITQLDD